MGLFEKFAQKARDEAYHGVSPAIALAWQEDWRARGMNRFQAADLMSDACEAAASALEAPKFARILRIKSNGALRFDVFDLENMESYWEWLAARGVCADDVLALWHWPLRNNLANLTLSSRHFSKFGDAGQTGVVPKPVFGFAPIDFLGMGKRVGAGMPLELSPRFLEWSSLSILKRVRDTGVDVGSVDWYRHLLAQLPRGESGSLSARFTKAVADGNVPSLNELRLEGGMVRLAIAKSEGRASGNVPLGVAAVAFEPGQTFPLPVGATFYVREFGDPWKPASI